MLYSLLLAGGKSSRMGQDKRLLVFRGRTLLEHSLHLLEQTGADEILISGDVEGYDCIPDIIPGCGPPGGIHAALHHIEAQGDLDDSMLLVIPVDMPLLEVNILTRLVAGIGEADSCHYENEIFPCIFRASAKLKNHLDALFAESTEPGGKRSMKVLLRAFDSNTIDTSGLPEKQFLNINSPEHWQECQKLSGD